MLCIILVGIAVMVINRCAGREIPQSIVEVHTIRRGQPVETGIATFAMNSISGADVDELMQTCPGECENTATLTCEPSHDVASLQSAGLTAYSVENGDDCTTSLLQS